MSRVLTEGSNFPSRVCRGLPVVVYVYSERISSKTSSSSMEVRLAAAAAAANASLANSPNNRRCDGNGGVDGQWQVPTAAR